MKKFLKICPIILCAFLICLLIYQFQNNSVMNAPNTLTLEDFLRVEPGISSYADVYKICEGNPITLTTSAYGTDMTIDVGEDRFFFIKFDMDLIVISIEYSRSKL